MAALRGMLVSGANRQCPVVVEDAATAAPRKGAADVAVGHGQTGERDGA